LGGQFEPESVGQLCRNFQLTTELVNFFRTGNDDIPRNPVLILAGQELLPDEPAFALKSYKDEMTAYMTYNDSLGCLCDLSVQKHLKLKSWGTLQHEACEEWRDKREALGNLVRTLRNRTESLAKC